MRGADRPKQVRVDLEEDQQRQLEDLYEKVPTRTREFRVWTSPDGQAFIAAVLGYRDGGVPVRWMAQRLEMDERTLRQIIEDGRRRTIRRRLHPSRPRTEGPEA